MVEQRVRGQVEAPDRTVFAIILTVVMVLVASIPAALVVIIYGYFARFFFLGEGSLIPYLNDVALIWFPEVMRGLVSGTLAIVTTQYFFKRYNEQAVKLATTFFWAAIVILLSLISVSVRGLSLDLVGSAALIVGLAVGLSFDRETS